MEKIANQIHQQPLFLHQFIESPTLVYGKFFFWCIKKWGLFLKNDKFFIDNMDFSAVK